MHAFFSVFGHCLGGERYDRQIPEPGVFSQVSYCFVSIHDRHHDIHEYKIKIRFLCDYVKRVPAVICDHDVHAAFFHDL